MVKQGYKRTEIGVIPENWDISIAGEKMRIYRGGSPRPIQDYLTNASDGVNWIKIGDVAVGAKYIDKTEERIKPQGISKSREVFAGDFLLSNSMSFGRPYILRVNGCIHDGWLVLQNYSQNFNREYLYYILSSGLIINQYINKAAGSSVLNLNKDIVSSVFLLIPPLLEQKQIAEVLSDADSLILSLEKMIAKKKAIKRGAMQQLITGKKRLDGFTGDWKEKSLEELSYLITKQTGFDYTKEIKPSLSNQQRADYIPFIQNKDFNGKRINLSTDFYIPLAIAEKYPRILLNEKCLLISISGRIGNVGLYDKERIGFIGGAVCIAKFNDKFNEEWVMLYLQSVEGQKQIFKSEKAGAQHNLTVEDIRKLVIPMPTTAEQTAIANILSNMDNEIEALEKRLAKCRKIKQGMMQELLTGRIRLVKD